MRYKTGDYFWHSRFMFAAWWTGVVTALVGTAAAAVVDAPGWVYAILIASGVGAMVAFLSDKCILGDLPTVDESRNGE